jgi:hypothetical protein
MTPPPLHPTAAENFQKLRWIYEWIDAHEMNKHALGIFFIVAYHLIECIEKDKASSTDLKARAGALRRDGEIKLCRELANGEKHFELDARQGVRHITGQETAQGWDVGRFGAGRYGVGEESVNPDLKLLMEENCG